MILIYHNIFPNPRPVDDWYAGHALPVSIFEQHIRWLADHFRIVSLDEYLESRNQTRSIKRKTVALTFDDGLSSTFQCVYPLLLQLNIPATFFVTTGHLEHGEPLWFSYLNALCFGKLYNCIAIKQKIYPLKTLLQCKETRGALDKMAKESGSPVNFSKEIAKAYPLSPIVGAMYKGMTHAQLEVASKVDLVELGAHTKTHPYLDQLAWDMQKMEINEGKSTLSEITKRQIRYFAYPGGEYNFDTLELVKSAGYKAAFAIIPKRLGTDDRFEVSRIGIYSPSLFRLKIKAIGGADFARKLGLRKG